MLTLLFHSALLLLSFYLLYLFTEYYFIPSLDSIGQRFGMTSDIAGSTLMAVGSSAPELAVMVISVIRGEGHEAIGVGTIVGSALFNLFVITGVVMIVRRRAHLSWQPMVRDLFFYGLTIGLLFWAFHDGSVSQEETYVFIAAYGVYLLSLYLWKRVFHYEDKENLPGRGEGEGEGTPAAGRTERLLRRIIPLKHIYLVFLLSVVFISVLAWELVNSAIIVSGILGVSEFVIAIVVIAIGTSMPDLVSSVIVARQGRAGMAINNAVGSNIFDILIGLGFPLFLYYLFSSGTVRVIQSDLRLSFSFLIGSILLLLFFFIVNKWVTRRGAGIFLIFLYVLYLYLEISDLLQKIIHSFA